MIFICVYQKYILLLHHNNKQIEIMTTITELKRRRALEVFNTLKNNSRFTKKEIENYLLKINSFLINELKYSKDLRNIDYLQTYFLERQYFKNLISLF